MLEFSVVVYIYGMTFVTNTGLSYDECQSYVKRSTTVTMKNEHDETVSFDVGDYAYKTCVGVYAI